MYALIMNNKIIRDILLLNDIISISNIYIYIHKSIVFVMQDVK